MRVTFKKQKRTRMQTEFCDINLDGKKIGTIQRAGANWFWYCRGVNTLATPKPLDECKADIKKFLESTK